MHLGIVVDTSFAEKGLATLAFRGRLNSSHGGAELIIEADFSDDHLHMENCLLMHPVCRGPLHIFSYNKYSALSTGEIIVTPLVHL